MLVSSRNKKINLDYSKIVNVTESINNRTITSKLSFSTSNVIFILQAESSWSNHVQQIAMFDNTSKNISILANWGDGTNEFLYNTIFEKVNSTQLKVKKYAQSGNILNNNFTTASDSDFGAIKPKAIYAILN